jgi:hypothetical protein
VKGDELGATLEGATELDRGVELEANALLVDKMLEGTIELDILTVLTMLGTKPLADTLGLLENKPLAGLELATKTLVLVIAPEDSKNTLDIVLEPNSLEIELEGNDDTAMDGLDDTCSDTEEERDLEMDDNVVDVGTAALVKEGEIKTLELEAPMPVELNDDRTEELGVGSVILDELGLGEIEDKDGDTDADESSTEVGADTLGGKDRGVTKFVDRLEGMTLDAVKTPLELERWIVETDSVGADVEIAGDRVAGDELGSKKLELTLASVLLGWGREVEMVSKADELTIALGGKLVDTRTLEMGVGVAERDMLLKDPIVVGVAVSEAEKLILGETVSVTLMLVNEDDTDAVGSGKLEDKVKLPMGVISREEEGTAVVRLVDVWITLMASDKLKRPLLETTADIRSEVDGWMVREG